MNNIQNLPPSERPGCVGRVLRVVEWFGSHLPAIMGGNYPVEGLTVNQPEQEARDAIRAAEGIIDQNQQNQ